MQGTKDRRGSTESARTRVGGRPQWHTETVPCHHGPLSPLLVAMFLLT